MRICDIVSRIVYKNCSDEKSSFRDLEIQSAVKKNKHTNIQKITPQDIK